MYRFAVNDFRGFRSVNFVSLRPITILIGENSSGKSSFLAGLKYSLDFLSASGGASFNKDPFQLGTFQQIAHYRGGRAGRAREFKLKLCADVSLRRRNLEAATVSFEATFSNFDSQAAIQDVSICANGDRISVNVEADGLQLTFTPQNGPSFPVSARNAFPRIPRSELSRYWPFLLQDIQFHFSRKSPEGENDLPPDIKQLATTLAEYGRRFADHVTGAVEATSAIRTKPRRTYTPGIEVRDGEGSHVPFEMAKLYRARSKDSWKNIKLSIDAFGVASQMFKEIGIKSFGNSVSDPFQIEFASDGPRTNIVDLGYGTSQILPILYDVLSAKKATKFLIQQPEVHLHPRAQAALGTFFVDAFARDGKQFVLETHSDFIVDRVRQAVSVGQISPEDVSILFFERHRLENDVVEIRLDETGSPISPPENYRSFFLGEQMKTLGF